MPVQVHPIAQAAAFLATGPGTAKQKLVLGGKLIWAARTYPGDWTPELLERANSIYRSLLTGGSVQKTVEQMDENAASKCLKQLTKDTAELAAETERARSQAGPRQVRPPAKAAGPDRIDASPEGVGALLKGVVVGHWIHFRFLPSFDTIRFFSIFFRR